MAYLTAEKKQELFGQYGKSNTDTGSPESQIALFSYRISHLTEHMKSNRHDFGTQRALLRLVGKRRQLLEYLKEIDIERYRAIIKTLGLFPEKVEGARRELEPSVISRYLLDVCAEFNRFYHDCPVLKAEDARVRATRLGIVKATANVLCNGLHLIGLKTPKNI